jgi:primosomal protein N' (replication factor Y)
MADNSATGSISPESDTERTATQGPLLIAVVAFPTALPGVFDYLVPPRFAGEISRGSPVLVPLRNRELWGVVVELKGSSPFAALKPVLDLQRTRTGGGDSLLKLYEWVAEYYQCSLGRVFRPIMSKGVAGAKSKTVQAFTFDTAADTGLLNDKYRTIAGKLLPFGEFTAAQVAGPAGVSRSELDYLVKRGFLKRSLLTVVREAIELRGEVPVESVELTDEQQGAVATVMASFDAPAAPYLLYGITGSGKTHVYIELVRRTLERGRGVIILVPEIALTPQTIQRFRGALGDVMTVIHSHMSDGERRDSLQELVTGRKRMVIGVRSAIMAPVEGCGLIIVDEEHDGSYKQSDCEPRYNARDVAVMRGRFQRALVVLGSATPSFESYYNAQTGKYVLLRLSQRFGAAALPHVKLVDMREEHAANNWQPLSRTLSESIAATIGQGRQVILLLNRRGFSTVLLCK